MCVFGTYLGAFWDKNNTHMPKSVLRNFIIKSQQIIPQRSVWLIWIQISVLSFSLIFSVT